MSTSTEITEKKSVKSITTSVAEKKSVNENVSGDEKKSVAEKKSMKSVTTSEPEKKSVAEKKSVKSITSEPEKKSVDEKKSVAEKKSVKSITTSELEKKSVAEKKSVKSITTSEPEKKSVAEKKSVKSITTSELEKKSVAEKKSVKSITTSEPEKKSVAEKKSMKSVTTSEPEKKSVADKKSVKSVTTPVAEKKSLKSITKSVVSRNEIIKNFTRSTIDRGDSVRNTGSSVTDNADSIITIINEEEEYEDGEYYKDQFLFPVPITTQHIKQIHYELGIVETCWPDITIPIFENRYHFPESYYKNNEKEKLAQLHAENFRRQFKYLYPFRRPLILASENGCGLQKFVVNTIRPTTLPYLDLKQWKKCAEFIADFITFEPLQRQTLPPERILGPFTVTHRQAGNSFEMANVLCSLLLGAGYKAYIVSGYATEDITTHVRYRTKCPIKTTLPEEEVEEEEEMDNKYKLRPIRDLRSKFLLYMVQREIDREEARKQAELERLAEEQAEREKAPPDDIYGWRVHAWILLLPKKDVKEPTFVEPTTGEDYPVNTDVYISIESIWNNENYWVNLQDCRWGLGKLNFDLTDLRYWAHLFIGEPMEHRSVQLDPEVDMEDNFALDEKHLDAPTPWSEPIFISHEKFNLRFPNGVKTTKYNRCILQQYGSYAQFDGLKHKLSYFSDFECEDLIRTEDTYENRVDHLTAIINDLKERTTTEYFTRGREDACKFHVFQFDKENTVELDRTLDFYYDFRLDGLERLEMNQLFLKQNFKNREDKLYFRHAEFAERGKPPPGMIEGSRRIVTKITEKFARDETKDANDDIAVRIFDIVENSIHLKFHYAKGNVTASTRDFIKPQVANRNDEIVWDPELTSGYQSEIGAKPPKDLDLYYLMLDQLKAEQDALFNLREIEDELTSFIRTRAIECAVPHLVVSLFNQEQNDEYKQGLKDREAEEKKHQEREVDEDIDYLTPYLIRLDATEELDLDQAKKVRDECLMEFKDLLTRRANNLKYKFETEYQEYLTKQQWFSSNMSMLDINQEDETLNYIANKKYLLVLYDMRLKRHMELSHSRYLALEDYLRNHEKLHVLYE